MRQIIHAETLEEAMIVADRLDAEDRERNLATEDRLREGRNLRQQFALWSVGIALMVGLGFIFAVMDRWGGQPLGPIPLRFAICAIVTCLFGMASVALRFALLSHLEDPDDARL